MEKSRQPGQASSGTILSIIFPLQLTLTRYCACGSGNQTLDQKVDANQQSEEHFAAQTKARGSELLSIRDILQEKRIAINELLER
jgi:hypothetical protein